MIYPPTEADLRAGISSAPMPFWRNHFNSPAAPASQEKTMEKHYANQGCSTLAEARPVSPIESAIDRLNAEIAEIHCYADMLISGIGAVLSPEVPTPSAPGDQRACASTRMSSPLAERIEQLAEGVRAARMRIVAAHDRLTL